MIELSTGEVFTLIGLVIAALGFWFGIRKYHEDKLTTMRNELREDFMKRVDALSTKMDDVIKNYVHKEDLRAQLTAQADLIKQARDETSRMVDRFDKFILMNMKPENRGEG